MYNKWMFLGWYFINIGNFFNKFYPTPLIFISWYQIMGMGLSLLMVHVQVVKNKTMCTLACLTPLLHAIHGNNSHYASGGYFIKYTQNAEKRQ